MSERITTGQLRSEVQPVVFYHLLEPVLNTDEKRVFSAGTLVAAQYWGAGLISLTAINGEKHMVVAHSINASKLNSNVSTNE